MMTALPAASAMSPTLPTPSAATTVTVTRPSPPGHPLMPTPFPPSHSRKPLAPSSMSPHHVQLMPFPLTCTAQVHQSYHSRPPMMTKTLLSMPALTVTAASLLVFILVTSHLPTQHALLPTLASSALTLHPLTQLCTSTIKITPLTTTATATQISLTMPAPSVLHVPETSTPATAAVPTPPYPFATAPPPPHVTMNQSTSVLASCPSMLVLKSH